MDCVYFAHITRSEYSKKMHQRIAHILCELVLFPLMYILKMIKHEIRRHSVIINENVFGRYKYE
ncbi:hypothetical protein T06_1817 [Trichinella sp. T6]|nr:hypothetical protein T06_1817 [Trichinella sp. T6]